MDSLYGLEKETYIRIFLNRIQLEYSADNRILLSAIIKINK